jgi:signal transduction histidine kinase
MKDKTQVSWIVIVTILILILIIDAYIYISESVIPFWQTEWFIWRISVLLILFIGFLFYFSLNKISREKEKFESFNKKVMMKHETELKFISGELHDSLGQNLSAANIYLTQNINSLPDSINEKDNLKKVSEILKESIEEVRRISSNIFPRQIERLGLTTAIESIIENINETTGIKTDFIINNIDEIFDKEDELYFYRIIQELLNNVVKHSGATSVFIEIIKTTTFISVKINDNGIGFEPSLILSKLKGRKGFGLMNLDERVRVLRGTLTIKSELNNGTKAEVIIPIKLN